MVDHKAHPTTTAATYTAIVSPVVPDVIARATTVPNAPPVEEPPMNIIANRAMSGSFTYRAFRALP